MNTLSLSKLFKPLTLFPALSLPNSNKFLLKLSSKFSLKYCPIRLSSLKLTISSSLSLKFFFTHTLKLSLKF